MIYFIEHDSVGNICHVCADPSATMVPVVNRVSFADKAGKVLKDANGSLLSGYGSPLLDPVQIDSATYQTLVNGGIDKYTYDQTSKTLVKKAAPGA